MRGGEWKRRLSEAWMTACDATLVIVLEDRGVYTASLVLSPLMAVCVCGCVCVCAPGGAAPTAMVRSASAVCL